VPEPGPLPAARPASASSASGLPGMPRAEVGGRTFQGSFGALDLTEVTQAIGLGGKTGRLTLALSVGDGSVLFESGRVIHAEFAGLSGESAFAALVAAAQHDPEGTFRFKPATGADAGPRTIQKNLDQLLISVASEIDEGRVPTGAPPPPPRTTYPVPRVLVVDDSLSVRKMVERSLQTKGYDELAPSSGTEAMERIGGPLPDLVVCDV